MFGWIVDVTQNEERTDGRHKDIIYLFLLAASLWNEQHQPTNSLLVYLGSTNVTCAATLMGSYLSPEVLFVCSILCMQRQTGSINRYRCSLWIMIVIRLFKKIQLFIKTIPFCTKIPIQWFQSLRVQCKPLIEVLFFYVKMTCECFR